MAGLNFPPERTDHAVASRSIVASSSSIATGCWPAAKAALSWLNALLACQGPLGDSRVVIAHGKARFLSAPCSNQYCVHQGWLSKVGQVAVCLPNQVSLELLGGSKPYDSLNY